MELIIATGPFLGQMILTFLGASTGGALVSYWLDKRRTAEIKKQEAIEQVADLLSKWVEPAYTGDFPNKKRWELISLYWKSILRLDKEILDILLPRLANDKTANDTNEIIVKCRQKLLNLKEPDIKASDLNNWLPKKDE